MWCPGLCPADLDIVHNILATEAEVAAWINQNLPSDRISIENGAIVMSCKTRWPLLIDPQLQGIKWIKTQESKVHWDFAKDA